MCLKQSIAVLQKKKDEMQPSIFSYILDMLLLSSAHHEEVPLAVLFKEQSKLEIKVFH